MQNDLRDSQIIIADQKKKISRKEKLKVEIFSELMKDII